MHASPVKVRGKVRVSVCWNSGASVCGKEMEEIGCESRLICLSEMRSGVV